MTGFNASMATYGQGFTGGVIVRDMPVAVNHPGKVFWVGNSGVAYPNRKGSADGTNKGTFLAPYATIDYAIGQCVANRGDIIMVLPNHAETYSAAAGFTADVAGITIQGMGNYDQVPQITLDTADTASVVITAADVTVRNIRLTANFADIAVGIGVTAKGAWVDGCWFDDQAADMNFLIPVSATGTTTGTADGLKVTNCRWNSADALCANLVQSAGTLADMVVDNNFVVHEGTDAPLVLFLTGKIWTTSQITNNFISAKGAEGNLLLVSNDGSTSTGIIAGNRVGHADATSTHDLGIDGLGCRLFDNLSVSTDALSGFVLPAIDTDA